MNELMPCMNQQSCHHQAMEKYSNAETSEDSQTRLCIIITLNKVKLQTAGMRTQCGDIKPQ
jgi:hypothetical protein